MTLLTKMAISLLFLVISLKFKLEMKEERLKKFNLARYQRKFHVLMVKLFNLNGEIKKNMNF